MFLSLIVSKGNYFLLGIISIRSPHSESFAKKLGENDIVGAQNFQTGRNISDKNDHVENKPFRKIKSAEVQK